MTRYKQNVVKHDETGQIIYPNGTSLLQFVSDNTDHDMATLDGKNTHHGLGSIAIANGTFKDISTLRKRIPRDKKEAWSKIIPNKGIEIKDYMAPNVPALTKTILKSITQVTLFHKSFNPCSLLSYSSTQFPKT